MKITDNVEDMVNKIDEALRRKLKDEFVHVYMDEKGGRQYPSISALSKRHDVANISLHRWSKKENWQEEKNRVQTEYELAVQRERMELMVQHGRNLDDRAINLALAMMGDVARRMTEDKDDHKLTPYEMTSLAGVVASAQKIGKLALGQAQEISKVSANVTAPESLREIISDLDELAAAKSSAAKHTIQ